MSYRALSSVYGKIEQILLTYPGYAHQLTSEKVRTRYADLFEAFGDRVTFLILGNFDQQEVHGVEDKFRTAFQTALSQSYLKPEHHPILISSPFADRKSSAPPGPATFEHNQWVQDNFCILSHSAGPIVFLEPYYAKNHHNQMVAEQIAAATDLLIKPTRYLLEGGNLLFGDDYALVGMNTFKANQAQYGFSSPSEFAGHLKQQLGVKYIIWIGTEAPVSTQLWVQKKELHQPFFHLDLFLNLGGKIKEENNGDELVFLAQITDEYVFGPGKSTYRSDWEKLGNCLKTIGRELTSLPGRKQPGPRFTIREIPLPLHIAEDGKMIPYSYHNCLVESYQGIKRLYYPTYQHDHPAVQKAEELALRTWSPHVRAIPVRNSFEYFIETEGGALHCMTKVLKRSPHF